MTTANVRMRTEPTHVEYNDATRAAGVVLPGCAPRRDVCFIQRSCSADAAATSLCGDACRPPLRSRRRDRLDIRVSDLLAGPAAPAAHRLLRKSLLHVMPLSLAPDVLLVSALQTGRLQEHSRQEDRESRTRHGGRC